MASINILGRDLPIEFLVGQEAILPMDEDAILAGAKEMAMLINSKQWSDDQAKAFGAMKKIIYFEGKVLVDGHLMDRPGVDQDDAIFYWEANEFTKNTDADVRANTFFHDCWHVIQFQRAGNKHAQGDVEPVEREVDAINKQIEVARVLGNDDREIKFLENFRDSQEDIKKRLREGVAKAGPHPAGAMRPGG